SHVDELERVDFQEIHRPLPCHLAGRRYLGNRRGAHGLKTVAPEERGNSRRDVDFTVHPAPAFPTGVDDSSDLWSFRSELDGAPLHLYRAQKDAAGFDKRRRTLHGLLDVADPADAPSGVDSVKTAQLKPQIVGRALDELDIAPIQRL